MTRQSISLRTTALALGVTAGSALLMGVVLASASTPPDFKPRLEALAAQARQTRDLLQPSPAARLFPPDAVCRHDGPLAAKVLRDGVSTAATQAGLNLDTVEAHVEPSGSELGALTPIRLKFAATGSYDGAVTLLAALARLRPELFADGVDLTAKTSNVTVSFSGRAFCAP